jgi:hypothetical protein
VRPAEEVPVLVPPLPLSARIRVATLAVVATLLLSCGGDTPPSPANPAAPAPAATPASGGTVGTATCRLGNGSPEARCGSKTDRPRLLDRVEAAIDQLVRDKPQVFDREDVAVPNTELYKVLDAEAYLDGIVANLVSQGVCAERDPDDWTYERILVKETNDYSETYDVLLSSGYVRRGTSAFVDTCTPASFPLDRAAIDAPPAGSGCGRPYPPPITRFQCKVHLAGPEFYTLDSTPMVGPDSSYCAAIGFTDGRAICPIRAEGAPDRVACEQWRVGKARDTGRPGPTWTLADSGAFCAGLEATGCQNSPSNQYQLWVSRSGRYKVSAENGAQCVVDFDR